MKRESLYCPCGYPIDVVYPHLAGVVFINGKNEKVVERCPSCDQYLKYRNLVELGNLELKEKAECL